MDRYAMHSSHVRVFMPRKKHAKNNKRDKELLKGYNARLVYPYETLGLYK